MGVLAACICLGAAGAALSAPNALASAESWAGPPSAVDPSFSAQAFSCASASLCITIGRSGPAVGSSAQQFSVFDGTGWTTPAATSAIDSSELAALSCAPGESFCVASDGDSGAVTYSGGSWSAPAKVGGDITALSCPTTTFCVGVNAVSGQQSVLNGTTWSTSAGPAIAPTAISCASATRCVAIGGSQAAVYDGSGWATPDTLIDAGDASDGQTLTSVSCAPGTGTCVAVDNAGTAYAIDSGDGLITQTIDDGAPLDSVSCVAGSGSDVDCVALDAYGGAVSTTAPTTSGSWSDPISDELSPGSDAFVSCSSAGTCGAIDSVTDSATAAGPTATSWTSGPTIGSGGFNAVSCAPDTLDCTLVDDSGHVVVIDGAKTSGPTDVDADVPLTTIACPSTAACLAGDANGNVITISSSGATSTTALDPSSGIAAIACPTTGFCDALADDGNDYTYNGSTWSSAVSIDASDNDPDALSCASASFCVAVDFAGNAFRFNGSSWSAATSVDPDDGLDAISCPSSSYCMTGDAAGGFTIFNGSTWSTPEGDLDPSDPLDAVDCTSADNCQLGGTGGIESDAGGQFTDAVSDQADVTGISCSSTAFCMAVDDGGSIILAAGAPANTGLPTVAGTATQGQTLTASPGTWTGSPSAYAYQWLSCPTTGPCTAIKGATTSTYTIPQVTASESFEVQVIAVNNYGDSPAVISAPTPAASVLAPSNTTVPTITGTAAVGTKLTAIPGTWSGVGTLTYGYQWYLCAKTCTAIAAATTATLTVATADIGKSLAVAVVAINSAGTSQPAVSQNTAVIPAPPATLISWLSPFLHLTGTAGHLAKIKQAKDYPVTFRAAIPGTVKVTWTITEKVAHTKRTKTVTVASVTAATTAPSTVIKVRLNKTGISVLKKLKRAKVKSTATFTYASGTGTKSYKATRTLTLRH